MLDNPLARKLSSFMEFTADELDVLTSWTAEQTCLRAGKVLIRQGDPTRDTCLVLDGWCSRHKDLRNGNRQIVGLMLPGDLCDLHSSILRKADHSISAISDSTVAVIPQALIDRAFETHPRIAKALVWASLVDAGLAREWIVNIGQRDATTALAHLLSELWLRGSLVGLATLDGMALPLTQTDLSEALGLTPVHINRCLQRLRKLGLVILNGRHFSVPDEARLLDFAEFDPSYLQLERRDAPRAGGVQTA